MPKDPVTKEMLIGDVVKKYPESIEIMLDYGIQCIGCHVATWETLEQAAAANKADINALIRKINESLILKREVR
ncbi:DUF1858 domain-containing protein [Candidatus Woesearchaeota archaeon]|nr:DUF1858 domain-containing protein [Candidatus Woesearchaeota archaeon]